MIQRPAAFEALGKAVLGPELALDGATSSSAGSRRRGGADVGNRAIGHAVRTLWLPSDPPHAGRRRLAGERQTGLADLAAGGAESAEEAT